MSISQFAVCELSLDECFVEEKKKRVFAKEKYENFDNGGHLT
jgi:hypothetical protein